MRKWFVIWTLYAGFVGFIVGASFFFGLYGRNVTETSIAAHQQHEAPTQEAKPKKEETDEALAFYTLWLMAFTGILAVATVGLGIATAMLYFTGEKQFRFAIRSSVKQSRDMQKSIEAAHDANRPWIEAVITEKREFIIRPEFARVAFMVSLRNKGNSPATAVMARAALVAVPENEYSGGDIVLARLEQTLDFVESVQPYRGIAIFPDVELSPQLYGDNIFRERLDEAAGGAGKHVRFWVAIGVRYKFGDREGQTIYAYLLKFPGRPETFATSAGVKLGPSEFELCGMALEYAT